MYVVVTGPVSQAAVMKSYAAPMSVTAWAYLFGELLVVRAACGAACMHCIAGFMYGREGCIQGLLASMQLHGPFLSTFEFYAAHILYTYISFLNGCMAFMS